MKTGGRGGREGGAGGGRRGPNFPQQTRQLASAEVLARGKAVYGVNCAPCHGADLRGGDQGGPSLLRSLTALSDQHGEEIGPVVRGSRQDKGMPAFNLGADDVTAVAEYIHSVLANRPLSIPKTGFFYVPERNSLRISYLIDPDPRGSMGLGGTMGGGGVSYGSYIDAIDYRTGEVVWRQAAFSSAATGRTCWTASSTSWPPAAISYTPLS